MTKDRKAALRTVFFFSSGTAMPTQMPRDRRQNFNSPMVFQSDSQMYWLAQRISLSVSYMVSYTYSLAHGMDGWKGLLTGLGKHATIKCRIHYTKQRAHRT